MKKILSFALLLMTALVGFTACSDDENDDPKLALVQTTWDFGDLNSEMDYEGTPWITTATRHFSFYDDHTGMFIVDGRNTWPEYPEWDDQFSLLTKFNYTFDGTAGTITLAESTMISDNPDYNYTSYYVSEEPSYIFTVSPDGKTMHFHVKDNPADVFADLPKLPKFEKRDWIEFPPSNSWTKPVDPRPYIFEYEVIYQ